MTTDDKPSFGRGSKANIPIQDLTKDNLVSMLPRDDDKHPLLSGIPLFAKIGQGGMGAVYFGVHPRLNMDVAIKVLPFHLADQNPVLIKRFFAEAQLAAQVKSQNVVNVLDVNEQGGIFFIVMEFVHGMSAADVLRKLKAGDTVPPIPSMPPLTLSGNIGGNVNVPIWAAVDMIIGATEGLAAAHDLGVIHRDVKPDNIMVPFSARTGMDRQLDFLKAKLSDLGLAKPEESQSLGTMSQMAMGTPGFMAPEQARDAKHAVKQSDIYSMGAALYSLIVGEPPITGSGIGDILIKTISEKPPSLSEVLENAPPVLTALLDRCLEKNPNTRPADGHALLDGLYEARAEIPNDAWPQSLATSRNRLRTGSRQSIGQAQTPPTISKMSDPGTAPTIQIAKSDIPESQTLQLRASDINATPTPMPGMTLSGDQKTIVDRQADAAAMFAPKPKSMTPVIVLLSILVLGGIIAGWWFGLEAPKRERDRLAVVEREKEAEAEKKRQEEEARKAEAVRQSNEQYNESMVAAQKAMTMALQTSSRSEKLIQWKNALIGYRKAFDAKPNDADASYGVYKAQTEIETLTKYLDAMESAVNAKLAADTAEDMETAREELERANNYYTIAVNVFPDSTEAKSARNSVIQQNKNIDRYLDMAKRAAEAEKVALSADTPSEIRDRLSEVEAAYAEALKALPDDKRAKEKYEEAKRQRAESDALIAALQELADAGRRADNPDYWDGGGREERLKDVLAAMDKVETLRPNDAELKKRRQAITKELDAYRQQADALKNPVTEFLYPEEDTLDDRGYPNLSVAELKAIIEKCEKAKTALSDIPDSEYGDEILSETINSALQRISFIEQFDAKFADAKALEATAKTLNAATPADNEKTADAYREALDAWSSLNDLISWTDPQATTVREGLERVQNAKERIDGILRAEQEKRSDYNSAMIIARGREVRFPIDDLTTAQETAREGLLEFQKALKIYPNDKDARAGVDRMTKLKAEIDGKISSVKSLTEAARMHIEYLNIDKISSLSAMTPDWAEHANMALDSAEKIRRLTPNDSESMDLLNETQTLKMSIDKLMSEKRRYIDALSKAKAKEETARSSTSEIEKTRNLWRDSLDAFSEAKGVELADKFKTEAVQGADRSQSEWETLDNTIKTYDAAFTKGVALFETAEDASQTVVQRYNNYRDARPEFVNAKAAIPARASAVSSYIETIDAKTAEFQKTVDKYNKYIDLASGSETKAIDEKDKWDSDMSDVKSYWDDAADYYEDALDVVPGDVSAELGMERCREEYESIDIPRTWLLLFRGGMVTPTTKDNLYEDGGYSVGLGLQFNLFWRLRLELGGDYYIFEPSSDTVEIDMYSGFANVRLPIVWGFYAFGGATYFSQSITDTMFSPDPVPGKGYSYDYGGGWIPGFLDYYFDFRYGISTFTDETGNWESMVTMSLTIRI